MSRLQTARLVAAIALVAMSSVCSAVAPNYPGAAVFSIVNATPVVIPLSASVVTSTVTVSGLTDYILDLDLITSITHTFCSDLDITLTSPQGTVVTITTDNGLGHNDVFNGTLWDDHAHPAGMIPHVTSEGLVSYHPYQDGVLASPLVPEEPLGAFNGENPNGVWTLTISDDADQDGGSLNSWELNFTMLGEAPTDCFGSTFWAGFAAAIPAAGTSVTSVTVEVSNLCPFLLNLNLFTNILHSFSGDLSMSLASPQGTIVTLCSRQGGDLENIYSELSWDDDANPAGQVPYDDNPGLLSDHVFSASSPAAMMVPIEALAAFIGEDPNGVWTLTVVDSANLDGGEIVSWTLGFVTVQPPTARLNVTVGTDSSVLPTEKSITVAVGTDVTVGYQIINDSSDTTWTQHTLKDDLVGTILSNFNYTLAAGASAFVTATYTVAGTHLHTATWTLMNDITSLALVDSATVLARPATAPAIECPTQPIEFGADLGSCSATISFFPEIVGDPTPSVIFATSPTLTTPGVYPVGTTVVTVTATNSVETVTCTYEVVVRDREDPTIECPMILPFEAGPGGTAPVPDMVLAVLLAGTFNDNCAPPSLSQSPEAGTLLPIGEHPIYVNAIDASTNYNVCQVNFVVVPGPSPTPTLTETEGPTSTPTLTQTESPSATPTLTETEGPSATPTLTSTESPSATPTLTQTEGPSATPTLTQTEGPSATPTLTETEGPSPTSTLTQTEGPSSTATPTGSIDPSATATPTQTVPTLADFDVAPDPPDGVIDSKDLLEWLRRIRAGEVTQEQLLLDFSRFWKGI